MGVGQWNGVTGADLDRAGRDTRDDRFATLKLLDVDVEPGLLEEAELLRVVRVGLRFERADGDANNRLVLRARRSAAEREDERDG
jgi:hypothetical protein